MNEQTINRVVEELAPALEGRTPGRVFQLGRAALALDFRTDDGRYLLLAPEPNQPRLYLIKRTVRELEKQSLAPSPFVLALRKHLSGARLEKVWKDEGERIVRFRFIAQDALGDEQTRTLVAQLTGRSANLLLLDADERIIDSLRPPRGAAQETGERYLPPSQASRGDTPPASQVEGAASHLQDASHLEDAFHLEDAASHVEDAASQAHAARVSGASPSAALDEYYLKREAERAFQARASAAAARLVQALDKRRKLQRNLERDLASHGDADEHKRIGDLLLANLATAERRGSKVRLTDYYADDAPSIELEIDEQRSLQEEAAHRFARYTKARRAAQEISERLAAVREEMAALERKRVELERLIADGDAAALEAFDAETRGDKRAPARQGNRRGGDAHEAAGKAARKASEAVAGARRYRSSDGYEILVGRGARDNDHLTFRVAASQDAWLHAADYPGSHVIVRNHTRGQEIPHRTIIEAAQLAAYFSQARKDSKVAVHYTQRKYVSKMRGAAPGLVRLSSFRTLMVEPRESVERI